MMPNPTWHEEMLWAATRSGWYGLLLLLIFALVFVWAVWHALRHRAERVLQHAVIGIYLVAASDLYAVFNILRSLTISQAASFQSALLWWNTYLQWKLSLVLLLLWLPVVLLALILSPRGNRIRNPGCMPGAITAVLGAMLLHLYFLAVFFGSSYYAANEQRITDEMSLRRRIKDLQEKIETQNNTSDGIRQPADGSPKPSR